MAADGIELEAENATVAALDAPVPNKGAVAAAVEVSAPPIARASEPNAAPPPLKPPNIGEELEAMTNLDVSKPEVKDGPPKGADDGA